MLLDTPIASLPSTSTVTIRHLKSLGIKTYWDLINYFPFRYENYSLISKIKDLQEGETVTVIGKIASSQYLITNNGLRIQKFLIDDESGKLELNWYNQPYLLTLLKKSLTISVSGEVRRFGKKLIIEPKEYEILNFDYLNNRSLSQWLKHTGRIIPIYSEIRGISSRTIREKIYYVLGICTDSIKEILPKEILDFNQLINEQTAYKNIHFPDNLSLACKAKERLSFDELFTIQLGNELIKQEWKKEVVGNKFYVSKFEAQITQFINELSFKLTNAQWRVIKEINNDLEKTTPMNRFLQGEVGSGKTVVAAVACYLSYLNGYQTLFMAPTEILAQQHYQTISNLFYKYSIKIGLHTGSKPISNFKSQISNYDIIIGTHALIQKKISFSRVGLVIIDEQHRFGVAQRALLKEKGINPHLLTMTATPIPRTVALTLYGELDLSVIDEMPKGRLPIKTYFVPKAKRQDCYQWIKSQIINNKSQAFIICPLIEQSKKETLKSVKAAEVEYRLLKKKIFSEFSLGLIHGRLKSKEKEKIMADFKNKKYDILVATPVVEVGIDIVNATIMLIEGAERFGLAQLHQLRGRVGRGKKQSYCFLFSDKENPEIIKRLKIFCTTQDGNILAEKDLQIRGPGNIYGVEQHGIINLKIASLSNYPMIEKTKNAVKYYINKYHLHQFEELEKRLKKHNIDTISRD